MTNDCPVCGGGEPFPFLRLENLPVLCHALRRGRGEALAVPRAAVDLALCRRCAHVFNRAFAPGLVAYTASYENSLHGSPRFRDYAETLARRLADRYLPRGGTVVEIGCGDGEFLRLLCRLAAARGVGFDPRGGFAAAGDDGAVRLIAGEFPDCGAAPAADLVCVRHVLEHLADPATLMDRLRTLGGAGLAVYAEVPNALHMLREGLVWDVLYEHRSYFTPPSLARLLQSGGFAVLDLREDFGGQYLAAEAARSGAGAAGAPDGDDLEALAVRFAAAARSSCGRWRARLGRWRRDGRRVVLWGAGSKAVTFLNLLNVAEEVAAVADVNSRKQGAFVAGTGHAIVAPAELAARPPDVVLVMNPLYAGEIAAQLRSLGLGAELAVLSNE
jgi:SAM-dependent methyltransferase